MPQPERNARCTDISNSVTAGMAIRSHCLPEAVRPFRRPEQKSTDYIASPDAARRIADVLRDVPLFAQLLDPLTGPIPSLDASRRVGGFR